ncbi:hypothetical protein BdWA1_000791 [Babesia duncani]|uniref:Uncharacterized protein n=1 Tax=Babesia duncani TaxID=323732 RepID=A0AAD9PGS9_9APIC|nr:hypothetical protein BdWA1_004159 [Babesia duncani]KAK2197788.1 hypothetical protein BdWA1_000791 [Babesia duncani]
MFKFRGFRGSAESGGAHAEAAALEQTEDVEGLKFQHGPTLDLKEPDLWTNSIEVVAVVDSRNFLLVGVGSELQVYVASKLLADLLHDRDHKGSLTRTLDLGNPIIHVVASKDKVACTTRSGDDYELAILDLETWDTSIMPVPGGIVDIEWFQDCLLITTGGGEVFKFKNGKRIRFRGVQATFISTAPHGKIALCHWDNGPRVACTSIDAKGSLGSVRYSNLDLENLKEFTLTQIVGCCMLLDDLVALLLLCEGDDTLLVICKGAHVLYYGINELFLDPSQITESTRPRASFKWLPDWNCLLCWCNSATNVAIASCNEAITRALNCEWRSLCMCEGYFLEPTRADSYPRGIAMCSTFKGSIYRKGAVADTPLLTDPPAFIMAQSGGTLSIHYGDIWVLEEDKIRQALPFTSLAVSIPSHAPLPDPPDIPVASDDDFSDSPLADASSPKAKPLPRANTSKEAESIIEELYGRAVAKYSECKESKLDVLEHFTLLESLLNGMWFLEEQMHPLEAITSIPDYLETVPEPCSSLEAPPDGLHAQFQDFMASLYSLATQHKDPTHTLDLESIKIQEETIAKVRHVKQETTRILSSLKLADACNTPSEQMDLETIETTMAKVSASLESLDTKLATLHSTLETIEAKRCQLSIQKQSAVNAKGWKWGAAPKVEAVQLPSLNTSAKEVEALLVQVQGIELDTRLEPLGLDTPDMGGARFDTFAKACKNYRSPATRTSPPAPAPVQVYTPVADPVLVPPPPAPVPLEPPAQPQSPPPQMHAPLTPQPMETLGANSLQQQPITGMARQSYSFGQESGLLEPIVSPAPSIFSTGTTTGTATGTGVFSSFAAAPKSLLDLAAKSATSSGGFTGVSGFTSGNFSSSATPHAKSGPDNLWTRARTSNPLD